MTPVGQLALEGAIARRHASRLARELAGVAENPVEALEELTGGKMLLILLGVGILGGGIYYLATRNAAGSGIAPAPMPPGPVAPGTVISPAPTTTAPNPIITPPLAPPVSLATQIVRPAAPGTFGTPMPSGPQVTMEPTASLQVTLRGNDYVNLILPAGATWRAILTANESTPNSNYSVDFGGDMVSPVSLPRSLIANLGYDIASCSWYDRSGAQQVTYVPIRLA